jgi:hypothetical protein
VLTPLFSALAGVLIPVQVIRETTPRTTAVAPRLLR